MIYFIMYTACWFLARIFYRFEVTGKEHINRKDGMVVCCNHISMIDPILVEIAWGGYPKFAVMGKEELFRNPITAFFFRSVGVFPVKRGTGDTSALDAAVKGVESGRGLLIHPEGTRSKNGQLGKLKTGAFLVAAQTGAAIQPCCILAKDGKVKFFKKLVVAFGPEIPTSEIAIDPEHKAASLRKAKAVLTQSFEELIASQGDLMPVAVAAVENAEESTVEG